MQLTNELQRLRQSHAELDQAIKVFEEADRVYTEALIAMGQGVAVNAEPAALTNIVFTFTPDVSGTEDRSEWT